MHGDGAIGPEEDPISATDAEKGVAVLNLRETNSPWEIEQRAATAFRLRALNGARQPRTGGDFVRFELVVGRSQMMPHRLLAVMGRLTCRTVDVTVDLGSSRLARGEEERHRREWVERSFGDRVRKASRNNERASKQASEKRRICHAREHSSRPGPIGGFVTLAEVRVEMEWRIKFSTDPIVSNIKCRINLNQRPLHRPQSIKTIAAYRMMHYM
jgi:hypothetical protein